MQSGGWVQEEEEGLNTAMADWMAAMSSRTVGHHHLLPAAAGLTSFSTRQIFVDHLSCGGHSTRHSEGQAAM